MLTCESSTPGVLAPVVAPSYRWRRLRITSLTIPSRVSWTPTPSVAVASKIGTE